MRNPTGRGIRSDSWGDGHYGASRGTRKHEGTDYLCVPGQNIIAPIIGQLTRTVFVYKDDLDWMGCEIVGDNCRLYIFYMVPESTRIMSFVQAGDLIGVAQDISKKYNDKMMPHVHLQFEAFNPELLIQMP